MDRYCGDRHCCRTPEFIFPEALIYLSGSRLKLDHMKLQSNVNKLRPNMVEYIYMLNETDHQWDFAGRREENSEL